MISFYEPRGPLPLASLNHSIKRQMFGGSFFIRFILQNKLCLDIKSDTLHNLLRGNLMLRREKKTNREQHLNKQTT